MGDLNKKVHSCRLCPRLTDYIDNQRFRMSAEQEKQVYWSKPVAGFGDPKAEILIAGLAPGAHGANRVGRMFSGDASGDWLFKALFEVGWSNKPRSVGPGDGLKVSKVFITSVVKCAPPKNLPTAEEAKNCLPFFQEEIRQYGGKLIIALGGLAFKQIIRSLPEKPKISFGHGAECELLGGARLLCSYHPSRYNQNTGRLSWDAWKMIFLRAKEILDGKS